MKRWLCISFLALFALDVAAPAFAARRVVVRHAGPRHRTTVVVHRGWPIRRALPRVVVRPVRVHYAVMPRVYAAPVVWTAVMITTVPASTALTWEDSETLTKDEDWTEFTLVADRAGRKLFLEVQGEAQLNFAEVVFANGDTQVVDLQEKTRGAGTYSLLDFADGRKVDHVRMVARAESDAAKIVLHMR